MKKKHGFDFEAADLDEKVIDEILSRRRCDVLVVRVPPLSCKLEPGEWKTFLKRNPPRKKTRAVDPFKYIIGHLTALIGNKNLLEKDRLKFTADRERYKKLQSKNREERNSPRGKKMFVEYIQRDQLHDLAEYIRWARKSANPCNRNYTMKESFALAAKIYNEKRNAGVTEKMVRDCYYRA